MKKIITMFLLGFVLLILSVPTAVFSKDVDVVKMEQSIPDENLTDKFVIAAENQVYELWVNVEDCQIVLKEKKSGREWLTSPSNLDTNENISKQMKEQMKSQLMVSFLDSHLNVVTVNSFAESVKNNTYEVVKVKNGLKITYDFQQENMRFKIPLQITLGDDFLEASLLFNEVKEYGTSDVTSIDLLPYWGAGRADEDGYLFIPNGSGALVRFSDNIINAEDWRQRVYGPDPAVDLMLKSVQPPETIAMPVFGVQKNGNAFLAVIHEGATDASIYATNNSRSSPYASVGSSFIYHQYDITGIRDKKGEKRQVPVTQKRPISVMPKVRYYFLNGDDTNYSGMVRRYQVYLEETQGLTLSKKSSNPQVSLHFYGLTKKSDSFFGIPITKKLIATSFSDVDNILKQLREKGVNNPNVFLYGFEKGGYQNIYSKNQTFDSGVGGRKGYLALLKNAEKASIYQSNDLLRDYGSSFLKSKYIRSLNDLNIKRWQPLLSDGEWNFDGASWRYYRPDLLNKNAKEWLKNSTKSGNTGVLLFGMGQELYSDFDITQSPSRDRTLEAYKQAFKMAKEKDGRVAGEGGNIYLAKTADILTNIPTASDGHDIVSEDIPFYSMVLHGYVQLVAKPINRVANPNMALLGLIAAGVQPSWQLTAVDTIELNNTSFNFLYNSQASNWLLEISQSAKEFVNLQNGLVNVPIYSHAREGALEIFTYENGVLLVVNNGSVPVDYKGTNIQPEKVVKFG